MIKGQKHTKSRNNNHLHPLANQLPPRLGKRQIPTHQQPDFPQRGLKDRIHLPSGGEKLSLRKPQIPLLVLPENLAGVRDEVCDVIEPVFVGDRVRTVFDKGTRNDADVEGFGEGLIGFEVWLGCRTGGLRDIVWVGGGEAVEVVSLSVSVL